ncbi:MAG: ABC transporter ATP-binding protein [Clostridiales bacterium]|nr:ABC transporter ATP-binding protein [Candidatus Equinaster intestinalis]
MIEIKNISFSYGEKKVFENFSLTVKSRERICLTARSGRGKTTLLRLITGLEKPQSGEIKTDESTKFSCVFQEDRLLPHHTVLRNLSLFGDVKRAKILLDRLGIGAEASKYPNTLSGGMKRRVALARALIRQADVYIFDEPFTGLDDTTKKSAAELINESCKDKTVILVSHETDDAKLLNAEIVDISE